MTAPVRDVPGLGEWRCRRCNRYLARIVGDRFERPNGDSARLPAVVRCKCGTRNVYLLGAGMSEIEGVTCFECGRARTADPTDGYEAWADGDQQGWICRECADQYPRARHFAEELRKLFPAVGYFHTTRWPDGRLVRGAVVMSWMTP